MTTLVDFANQAQGDYSIRPQAALIASTNGGGVDLQLTDGPTHLVVAAGATDFTSLDETYSVKLQESDAAGGTYTDIPGASVAVTAPDTTKLLTTRYRSKRFVRAALTVGGTTPSILVTAYVFGQKKVLGGSGTQL